MIKTFFSILALFSATALSANIILITSTSESGPSTFEQAIIDANAHLGLDTVKFNLTGTGPFKLGYASASYTISDSLFIDGFSQPGNTAGSWLVEIPKSLIISASNVTISGLKFLANREGFGIKILPEKLTLMKDIMINNNYIDLINGASGIFVGYQEYAHLNNLSIVDNEINGTHGIGVLIYNTYGVQSDSILISDNTFSGCSGMKINQSHGRLSNVYFVRNTVRDRGNGYAGVEINQSSTSNNTAYIERACISDNVISYRSNGVAISLRGTGNFEGSIKGLVISNNRIVNCGYKGIYLSVGGTGNAKSSLDSLTLTNNVILSNNQTGIAFYLSPNAAATTFVDNIDISKNEVRRHKYGIQVRMSGSCALHRSHLSFGNSFIQDNIVHDNFEEGIWFRNGGAVSFQAPNYHGMSILRNSIYNNGSLGLFVRDYYFSNGSASVIRVPYIQAISRSNQNYLISGKMIKALPNTTYWLEFFVSRKEDPGGFGEGEIYMGGDSVKTDANGDGNFTYTTSDSLQGRFVSATATQVAKGNTSEFSNAYYVNLSTAITEPIPLPTVELYPNPASNMLNLRWSQDEKFVAIKVISMDGKIVLRQSLLRSQNTIQLPVEGLSNGIYAIFIEDKYGRVGSKRWLKN